VAYFLLYKTSPNFEQSHECHGAHVLLSNVIHLDLDKLIPLILIRIQDKKLLKSDSFEATVAKLMAKNIFCIHSSKI
jgi:hypothetical protein